MELNELMELSDGAYENTRIYKERTKKWNDSRLHRDKNFKVGDKVLLFNSRFKMHQGKLRSRWYGPNMVKTVYPYGIIEIIDRNGISFKVNGQRLKKYHDEHTNAKDKEVVEFKEDTTCFKIVGYPADFWKRKAGSNFKGKNVSNNVVGSNSSNGFSDEQMATLISLIKRILSMGKWVILIWQVARDSKLVIAFDEMHCYVMNQDLRKEKILGTDLVILLTKLPTFVLNEKSPYDLVYNKPPSLKHLRTFSCLVYATILNSHDKFGSRSENFVLVGYSNFKNGYKLWSLDNKHIVCSRDVMFFEDIFPFKQNNSTRIDIFVQDVNHLNFFNTNTLDNFPDIPNDEEKMNPSPIRHGNSPSHSCSPSTSLNENDAGHFQDADASASENGSFAAYEENNSNSKGNGLHDQSQENVSQANNDTQNLRRSSKTSVFPRSFNDFVVESKVKYGLEKYVNYSYLSKGNYCFATMLNKGVEPKTYLEASQHKHWVDAKNAEMDALYKNNTWEIIDLPVGRKAIDINNAFLYGDLKETVYMTLPPGYFPVNETKVCRLNKSIYGLKQAPRQWNAKLTVALLENNFVQSKSDHSLFTKSVDNVFIDLLVYVDDIIIAGNSLAEIEKVKQFLKTKFMIKDLGKLKYFLGIKVLDTSKGVCLNQRNYYLELIDEFGLLAKKPSSLPIQPNISLTSKPSDTDPLLENITKYLKGSPCKGINVIKGSASGIDLKAYLDADWAKCTYTRGSITGYYVFMCGSLVS
ncbi:ribonuclease H-like domain-containing protein [Tanacetum coccineum]